MEGFWKGDCDLRFVVDEVYDTLARLPGSKAGEILVYVGLEWVDRGDVGCTMVYWGLQMMGVYARIRLWII